jgi:hypothetical protein
MMLTTTNFRRGALLATAVACAALAALSARAESSGERWPIARATSTTDGVPENTDGPHPNIEAAIVPDAVNVKDGRESIEYHAQLTSRLTKAGNVAWTICVTDDEGKVVTKLATGVRSIDARGEIDTAPFSVNLPDGYYALRVRAAIHTKDWDDATEAVQHVAIARGKMRELSHADWFAYSRASIAVQDTKGGAR